MEKNKKDKKEKKGKKEKKKKDKKDKIAKKSETIQIPSTKVLVQVSNEKELWMAIQKLEPFQFSPDFQYHYRSSVQKNQLQVPELNSEPALYLFLDALDQAPKNFTSLDLGYIPQASFNDIVCTRLLNNKTLTTLSVTLCMKQAQREAVLRIIRENSNVKRLQLLDREHIGGLAYDTETELYNRVVSLRALVEAAKTLPHLTLELTKIYNRDMRPHQFIQLIVDGISASVIDARTALNNVWLHPFLLRAMYQRKLSLSCLRLSGEISAAELNYAIEVINRDELESLDLQMTSVRAVMPQIAAALKDTSRLRELTWDLAERPFFDVYEYHSNLEQLSISGGDFDPTRLLDALLHRNPKLHTLNLPKEPLTMAQWRIIGDIVSKYGTLSTLNLRLVPKDDYASEYLKILDDSTITSLTINQSRGSEEMKLNAQQYLEQAVRTDCYLLHLDYYVGSDSLVSAEMKKKLAQNRSFLLLAVARAKMFVKMMTMRQHVYFSILPLDCWMLVLKKVTLPALRLDQYLLSLLNK